MTVRNDGLLDATGVTVYLNTTNLETSGSFSMDVPAGQTQEFLISMNLTEAGPGPELFVAHIDAGENSLEGTPADLTQSIDIVSRPVAEPSSGLAWVLGALFALIVFSVFNNWRKRGTSARF